MKTSFDPEPAPRGPGLGQFWRRVCPDWVSLGAAALLVLPALAGCAATNSPPACCTSELAPQKYSDKSLYQTESIWTTDAGKKIKLSALAGKPQVVVMFFASCQFTCPVTVHELEQIEAALPPELRERVGFTLVSFDSRRDTPVALAHYREAHQLSPKNWTLLRGEPDDVLELAALLGVKFKQDARGDFAHSNLITVLNADGEVVEQVVGLNQDLTGVKIKLKQLCGPRDE
jgi:protein SCO1/2